MNIIIESYSEYIDSNIIVPDKVQAQVIELLQELYNRITLANKKNEFWMNKLMFKLRLKAIKPVQGLYLWGGVGRGKTLLIDLFFDRLPFKKKMRLHFHRFMRKVHQELNFFKGMQDPLEQVAKNFAAVATIICFDEFYVSDITDAMLLGRLLDKLFAKGVTLIITSNIPPHELYKDGLQRESFLPAISLLEKNLLTFHLDSQTDYRFRTLTRVDIYHYPADAEALAQLEQAFIKLAPEEGVEQPIEIEGRNIPTVKVADDVVWFEFLALCDGPRSQADYIEIACCYHTVLISNVPVLTDKDADKARRFIAAIDEFYDRRVKLIIVAEDALQKIYQGSLLSFEFKRTISRLVHMQSKEYLGLAHKP